MAIYTLNLLGISTYRTTRNGLSLTTSSEAVAL